MGGILRRIVAVASWLLSRERLAEIPGDAGGGRPRSRGFWGWISGSSELTDAPVAEGSGVPSRRFWSWIVSGEEIPTLPEETPRGVPSIRRFWAAIFAGGDLDAAEIEGTGRTPTPGAGFVRWLLSVERCPEDRRPVVRSGKTFWQWLASSERL